MTAPAGVRYARASGDVDIAYTVFGEGPFDVVFTMGFVTHLDLEWTLPWFQDIRSLGRVCRVLVFDKRGTGLSDRTLGYGSLEERTDDIRAVMDAAGSQRAVIYGISEAGPMALLFAATYPDRVQGLVLYGTFARFSQAPGYALGSSPEEADAFIDFVTREWGTGRAFGFHIQNAPDPAENERFLAQFERNACTPQMVAQIEQRNFEIDVRSILPTISAPTLVMHCAADPVVPVELGRYVGEHIPGARYVEIDGDFHASWRAEDRAKLEPPFIEFLGSIGFEEPPRPATRVLATVLFTDIVGSTERAAEMGDRVWRATLDKHDAMVAERVAAAGGRLVKTTGDGVLATFVGPSAGIDAARAIRDRVRAFDVEVRAGVHTGEVELRDGDIGGIGVHIAARIATLAGAGEIFVSRTVKDLVTGSGLVLQDRGTLFAEGRS
jgi:pimeloyl-ACP methyl ester carboxylesterase